MTWPWYLIMEGLEQMSIQQLTCFKSRDVRGGLGVNSDANRIVVGWELREKSPSLAAAAARGITDAGANVLVLGLSGTKKMYWSETEFGAWAVIKVTTSNNSINYNGIKIVKSGSRPLYYFKDFPKITALAGKSIYMQDPQRVTNLAALRFPERCICA